MDTLIRDVRYAIRTLRRAPGFSVLAMLTIAVGVGATAGVFSVINAALLRPLPFDRPDDLMLASQEDRRTRQGVGDASPANFLDWRSRSRAFSGMAAMRGALLAVSTGDRAEPVAAAMVSANFFRVLGVTPAIGRAFQPDDERPGSPRVAVASHDLWRQRFGGRTDIVGQRVRINDEPYTIVGVLPPRTEYPDSARLWVPPHWPVPDDPLAPGEDPSGQRSHGYIRVLARLAPGTSRAAAQADLERVAAGLERDYPTDNANVGIGLQPLRDDLVGDLRPTLLLLFAAVGLLLVLSTTNVSGLLIVRASGRHQEMAVRAALGASRRRIVSQLLIESLLLALGGGAAGVLIAAWVVGPLVAMSPASLGLLHDVGIDLRVLGFGLLVSTAAGVLFGLAPARQMLKADLHDDLKHSARSGGRPRQRRLRAGLVMAEIALSLVLLIGAGLTIRSLVQLQRVPAGFDPAHVLTLRIALSQGRYPTADRKAAFWDAARARLQEIPGIEAVGAASRLPLVPGNSTRGLMIDGRTPAGVDYRTVTPDYFRAMGIPILRGRAPDGGDDGSHPPVAVISASLAAHHWSARDPIGRQFVMGRNAADPPVTIIGVVADLHHASLDAAPVPTIYVPSRQDPWPSMTFAIRATGSPAALSAAAREAIWRVDKDQPVGAVVTMEDQLSRSLSGRRFSATLLSGFGALAIVLAAIGLYGVLAFIVMQQRREIGLRMALGATRTQVVAAIVRQGLMLACGGVAIGLAAALVASRFLAAMLYGVTATDAATFASVAAVTIVVAVAASAAPAWRASRVDPLQALRDGGSGS